MYSNTSRKTLNYKLRELELIITHINNGNEPSKIDIDLALDKTRELYNILLNLEPGNSPAEDRHSSREDKSVVPSDPVTEQDDLTYEAEGITPYTVRKQKEEPQNEGDKNKQDPGQYNEDARDSGSSTEPVTDNKDGSQSEKQDKTSPASEEVKEPDTNSAQKSDNGKNENQEIEIVADRYQSSQNYINQVMADKQVKKNTISKMHSRPIIDLRNSIGLNEKFLFIKELFKGRPEKYNQCIDALNQTTSLDEAINYINENYDWKEDNEVAEKLINLIKRKHQTD